MRIRVSVPSYKLVYEQGSEEMIWRALPGREIEMLKMQARAREEERRRSVFLM